MSATWYSSKVSKVLMLVSFLSDSDFLTYYTPKEGKGREGGGLEGKKRRE